jgi:hypothetical protein
MQDLVNNAIAACRRLQMTADEVDRALLLGPGGTPAMTADRARSMCAVVAMLETLLLDVDTAGSGWLRLPNRRLRGRRPLDVACDGDLGGPTTVEALLAAEVERRRRSARFEALRRLASSHGMRVARFRQEVDGKRVACVQVGFVDGAKAVWMSPIAADGDLAASERAAGMALSYWQRIKGEQRGA